MSLCSSAPPCGASRRGVLLLITVSMLTLFMMLGTAYLVVATRARESARALARRTLTAEKARIDHSAMLDQVLLTVVRGTAAGQAVTTGSGTALAIPFESLLADRYGNATIAGTWSNPAIYSARSATALSTAGTTGPVVTGTFTMESGSVAHPAHLNGRILTFTVPSRPPTSHRILRASREDSNSPFSLTLSNPPGPYQLKAGDLPTGRAIINGREFAGNPDSTPTSEPNESWDGFDDKNAFLAHVKPDGVSRTTVARPSYAPDLTGDLADNDNDGVPDGVFLDFGLPSIPISSGTSVQLDASVLVVDLDGRFNVNAHGSPANFPRREVSQQTRFDDNSLWPADESGDPTWLENIPLGSGLGPADVNAGHIFSSASLSSLVSGTQGFANEQPGVSLLYGLSESVFGKRPEGSRFTSGQSTPRAGACEGRFGGRAFSASEFWDDLGNPVRSGTFAEAGLRSLQLTGSASNTFPNNGIPPIWWQTDSGTVFRSIYNSPPDLHGHMKVLTRAVSRSGSFGVVPRLSFVKPDWSDETESIDYLTRLRSTGARGGYVHAASTAGLAESPMPTNPFTVGELERLLRPYDLDTNLLPPRLAIVLGTIAEEMRTRLTSESWDTTGIVDGRPEEAWGLLASSLATISGTSLYGSTPLNGVLGGEIARGERFNLNRPLTGIKPATYDASAAYYEQRQAYFKDLYTLLTLLASSVDPDPDDEIPSQRDRLRSSLPDDFDAEFQQELAQWAANVVEFRDADSVMTPFEYDTDIFNGWDVDGNMLTTDDSERGVVFGAERPELLLTHTLAWESDNGGELVVCLHRPWQTRAHAVDPAQIAAESIDPLLDVAAQQQNKLDLTKKSGDGEYPVWRLRIVAANDPTNPKFVRFDTNADGADFVNQASPNSIATLAPDSWLCVRSNTNSLFGGPTGWLTFSPAMQAVVQDLVIDQGGGGPFRAPGSLAPATPPEWPEPREVHIYLERLADPTSNPSLAWSNVAAEWTKDPKTTQELVRYVVVDQAPIQVIRRSPQDGNTVNDYTVSSRGERSIPRLLTRQIEAETAFWMTDDPDTDDYNYLEPDAWAADIRGLEIEVKLLGEDKSVDAIDVAWLPWPNRPFFSSAELLLVPKYSAIGMLENYRLPLAKQGAIADGNPHATDLPRTVTSGTTWPILDAVTVPTLFAAIHDSWVDSGGHLAAKTGIHQTTHPVNQLSSYREPGRVNLNTITNEQVWDAVVSGPLKSGALISGTAGTASLAASPAKTMRDALALGTGSNADPLRLDSNQSLIVSGTTSALNVARNPMHRLYTAGRLANVATTRSNVFAIWVTLREQVPNDPDSVRYHRGFYVVDRSIPVGYEEGRNHNVRDTILLRRIIE